MAKSTTITVSAKQYEDCDDCLAAAAADVAAERGLEGYDLGARWADESREEIALDVPMTFAEWLEAAGRDDSASEYDLRAAWRAGEDPAEYAV